jgi:hypothetical protein
MLERALHSAAVETVIIVYVYYLISHPCIHVKKDKDQDQDHDAQLLDWKDQSIQRTADGQFKPVYFDFDNYDVRADQQAIVDEDTAQAQKIMNRHNKHSPNCSNISVKVNFFSTTSTVCFA